MPKNRPLIALAAAFILSTVLVHPARGGAQSAESMNDRQFARFIAGLTLVELRAAQLALDRSQNDTVQRYAKMMIEDHTQVAGELTKIGAAANLGLPKAPPPEVSASLAQLQGLSGAAFDRKFMEDQVNTHYKEVAFFQHEADSGTEPAIKTFAGQYLAPLQKHLRMAQAIISNADKYLAGK